MTSRKKLLIVEDAEPNRIMLEKALGDKYEIITAENGLKAIDILSMRCEEIALILLDILMPIMDGYTFLSIVKNDIRFSALPVVVLTREDTEAEDAALLSAGADDFISRPYSPKVILRRIDNLISLRESAIVINQLRCDAQTGVFSKEYFFSQAEELLLQNPDKHYDIICSDIEDFDIITEVYGANLTDELLKRNAAVISDAVKGIGLCGRIGEDVFAAIIESFPRYDEDSFSGLTAKINTAFAERGARIDYGVCRIIGRHHTIKAYCDRAMTAIETVRGQYDRHFAIYDDAMHNKLVFERTVALTMERAIKNREFEVYLQPKYNIASHKISGAEALVRWNHPELGFLTPGSFIPVFEKNGFITELDKYVWEETCRIIRRLIDEGQKVVPISVNVSRADIYIINISEVMSSLIEKYGLKPENLHLEITESVYIEDTGRIINTVKELRSLGFRIEMDDFGTGYSSLNILSMLPIDVLKLDIKFIGSNPHTSEDHDALAFISALSKWLNLSMIAEGVETDEQVERLKKLDCRYAQGYHYAKPMPYGEFQKLLAASEVEDAACTNKGIELSYPAGTLDGDTIRQLMGVKDDKVFISIIDSIPEGFALIRLDEHKVFSLVFANKPLSDMLKMSPALMAEAYSGNAANGIFSEDAAYARAAFNEALSKNTATDTELRLSVSDGTTPTANVRIIPVSIGNVSYFNCLFTVAENGKGFAESRSAKKLSEHFDLASRYFGFYLWSFSRDEMAIYQYEKRPILPELPNKIERIDEIMERGLVYPDDIENFRTFSNALISGKEAKTDIRFLHSSSGKYAWYRLYAVYDKKNGEKANTAQGIALNIDAEILTRHRYELEASRRSALDKNAISFVSLNLTEDFVAESRIRRLDGIYNFVGLPINQMTDKFIEMVDRPTTLQLKARDMLCRENLMKAYENGEAVSCVFEQFKRTGNCIWIKIDVSFATEPVTNNLIAFLYGYDITAEKTSEEIIETALRSDYELLTSVDLDNDRVLTVVSRENGEQSISPDMKISDAVRLYSQKIHEEDLNAFLSLCDINNLKKILREKPSAELSYRMVFEDGTECCKRSRFIAQDIENGIAFYSRSDITEIVRREREHQKTLSDALAAAEQASIAKTNFLSKISHEIRTPMNAIIGMSAIAEQSTNNPEAVLDCLEKIDTSSKFLLSLINDILDMSRIESGKLLLKNSPFDIGEMLTGIEKEYDKAALEKGVILDCSSTPTVFGHYYGDEEKLRQVLTNILENALKFTERGGRVTFVAKPHTTPSGTLTRFIVSDTGIGMSDEFLPHIFDTFSQESTGTTAAYNGTGLGLAIAKSIVDMMKGTISVRSIRGIGTEFTIDVPLKPVIEKTREATISSFSGKSAFVVETDSAASENIVIQLREMGIYAECFDEPTQAAEHLRARFESGTAPNYLIIGKPLLERQGIDTFRNAKRKYAKDAAVILICACDFDQIEEAAKAAGISAHVDKPVFRSALIAALSAAENAAAESELSADLTGKRILVVEDHPMNVDVLTQLLESRGMTVDSAENGLVGMDTFSKSPCGCYSAILMDIRMPLMDGLTATRNIRNLKHPDAKSIPIIAMTANAFDDDVEKSLAAGMNAHLCKPIDPSALFSALARYAGNR